MKNKGRSAGDNEFERIGRESRTAADAATATASQPDELEARRRQYVMDLDKWESGESGPIDVRNMPRGDVAMGLFNDSMKVHDAGRKGIGVGVMNDNANPNYVAALNKEHEMERHKMASGALEQHVSDQLAAKDAEMTGLYQTANARNMNIAGLREGRYQNDQQRFTTYLMRQKQPNFFRQLAQQWLSPQGLTAAAGM